MAHLIDSGATNHPQKDWASREDMIKSTSSVVTDDKGQEVEIDLQKCFNHSMRLGSNKLRASDTKQIVPLLVNISETNFDSAGIDIDTKIDLVCVIDISGSMAGSKIDFVRKTMHNLLEVMPGHRIAIVLFDSVAELFMNFKIINEENLANIKIGIDSIQSRGSTNITAGVHMAQVLLGRRETKNSVSSIFVLSDGEHNCGGISNELLFKNDLLRTKTEYTLTSFGYGDDHDAKLLQMMSEEKGGNYYFVNDISKVEECFLDCLGMVTSVLGQNVKATITLTSSPVWPEIRFMKTFGNYWTHKSEVEKEIKLSSFYAGISKNFIAQIELDPVPAALRNQARQVLLAQCHIEVETLGQHSRKVYFTSELKIDLLPIDSAEDIKEIEDVQKQYTRVQGADIIEKADELERNAQYDEAKDLIEGFKANLSKFKDDAIIGSMNDALVTQQQMIVNKKAGIANEFKSENYAMQQMNCFRNEQSAPQFSKGLYQNKKQTRMSKY